ncbi:L-histidine N(alpha)-methyltransferase [Halpernia frigidisoli]|uniref:Dimethylhistidine N-methyltransferase n=1 Tax=Halpernia frigidisoli TaxID=1125876 RepID=A0A1I3H017_9FLAO|nr:L-histidine N(alpha)-methyltransferase [Halpernia frigidisoli]SFI28966.1 dimethylhistidine N-methyltransferase [Halpernia frigidisoli]
MTKENTFLEDIDLGLSSEKKFISSHFFYDKIGDELFQKIMELPEYYLTNCELEIFRDQSESIISSFDIIKDQEFELIELGAGDGKKTQYLLDNLLKNGYNFKYIPVDISQNSLDVISDRLVNLFPYLTLEAKQGEYFTVLDELFSSEKPKVILFIGSNLGNLNDEVAHDFLNKLATHLKPNEKLLLGLDLIKSREIVLPAYNDAQGVTREFNMNLLKRINEDLGANFILENFKHQPEYTEEGFAKSYLVSKIKQEVYVKDLDKTFEFDENEKIHTEISRKYNDEILNDLLKNSSLEISDKFLDSKNYFADYILTKK